MSVLDTEGSFDFTVFFSTAIQIFATTVILFMLYDRSESRRLARTPYENHPSCVRWLANVLVAFGMGQDSSEVDGLINYDAYYTSHYCWGYVYHLFGLLARIASIPWLLAVVEFQYVGVVVAGLVIVRIVFIHKFNRKPILEACISFETIFALLVTDNAIEKITKHETDMKKSQRAWVFAVTWTAIENIICCGWAAYGGDANESALTIYTRSRIFAFVIICTLIRYFMVWHWLLPVHFSMFYVEKTALENFEDVYATNRERISSNIRGEKKLGKRLAALTSPQKTSDNEYRAVETDTDDNQV